MRKDADEVVPLLIAVLRDNKNEPPDKKNRVYYAALGALACFGSEGSLPFPISWTLRRITRILVY